MARRSVRELLLRVKETGLDATGTRLDELTRKTGAFKKGWIVVISFIFPFFYSFYFGIAFIEILLSGENMH